MHVVGGLIDFVAGQTSTALLDLGIGAAGSEVVAVPDLHLTAYDLSGASHNTYQQAFVPGAVAVGTRLSYRGQVSAGNAARYVVMLVYGYR